MYTASIRISICAVWLAAAVAAELHAGPITFVTDVNGSANGRVRHLTVYNGDLYFAGRDDVIAPGVANSGLGGELFRYNSVTNSISLAADVRPGPNSGVFDVSDGMAVYQGELYFQGQSGSSSLSVGLHRYNSTTGTVTQVAQSGISNSGYGPVVFNGDLYIGAFSNPALFELHKYDGSNISLVADLGNNSATTGAQARHKAVLGDRLFFNATDGLASGPGLELYYITNTSNVPVLAADVRPGVFGSSPEYLAAFNGKLYFAASDGSGAAKLFVYDPVANTFARADPSSSVILPEYLTVFDNALYFSAFDPLLGRELHKFDGTSISLVEDFTPGIHTDGITGMAVYNGELYFGSRGPTPSGGNDIDLYKLSPSSAPPPAAPVPEPTSVAIWSLVGLVGIACGARRRGKKLNSRESRRR